MIAASISIGRALAPIELLVANGKSFSSVRASYARLQKLIEAACPEPERMTLPRPDGETEAETIVVTAPGKAQAILQDVSVRILRGDGPLLQ